MLSKSLALSPNISASYSTRLSAVILFPATLVFFWSSYMLKNLFRPPSPEAVRHEMIAETARQLLHAEGRLRQAQADRDTYDQLLTHLKSLNFQGLSSEAAVNDSQ
jgi:hypothetical protein